MQGPDIDKQQCARRPVMQQNSAAKSYLLLARCAAGSESVSGLAVDGGHSNVPLARNCGRISLKIRCRLSQVPAVLQKPAVPEAALDEAIDSWALNKSTGKY